MLPPSRLTTEESLQDEIFEKLDLPHADLSGKELCGCTFRHVKLQESRWKKSRLEDCVFEDCDLTRLDPAQLALFNVTFRRSKLMGIDWTQLARNPTLEFEDCDLRYASFVGTNLSKCSIRGCKATEANFLDCNLSGADFSGTDLAGANIEGCDLTRANLAFAQGAFLNPSKNRTKGALISVESAVLLARFLGMRVEGWDE